MVNENPQEKQRTRSNPDTPDARDFTSFETPVLNARCLVVRGLVKELEEELNKFLSSHPVRVLHMAQSESADHVTVTLLFEPHDVAS